jgi:chromosomal replication initiation ATPase DnaA
MTPARQLPLPFAHASHLTAAEFLAAPSNEEALAWLRSPDWPQLRLALWGPEGSGKTHLLHVWAGQSGARLLAGPGLRFPQANWEPPQPLAIDDADAAPERDLLHLLNAAQEAGAPALLAARAPPSRWGVALPDLASRLRSITAAELRPPEDTLLRSLLARLLAERQIAVPEAVQDWLRLRLPRTQGAMREAAARLDRAALAAGGRVTRALAAQVLDGLSLTADHDHIAMDEDFAPGPALAPPAAARLL